MAESRSRHEWSQTSMLCAVLVNCHKVKGRRVEPKAFNPWEQPKARRKGPTTPLTPEMARKMLEESRKARECPASDPSTPAAPPSP